MQVYKELTPLTKEDLFIVLDSINQGFDYPIHNHPEYELTLISGSSGNRIVGDSRVKYREFDLVLLGPYIFHKWDDEDKKGTEDEPCRVVTLQFEMDLFDHNFLSRKVFHSIKDLLIRSSRGVRFTGMTRENAREKLLALFKLDEFESVTAFLSLLNFLAQSEEYELLASEEYDDASSQIRGKRMQLVHQYLIANFHDPALKISDVADIINLSESAFGHFFKKSTGKSFSQFLIDLRLRQATNLLLQSDDQIATVCLKSGFNNHANFNRLFKRKYHTTPLQFRKKYQDSSNFDWSSQKSPGQFVPLRKTNGYPSKPSDYATKLIHR